MRHRLLLIIAAAGPLVHADGLDGRWGAGWPLRGPGEQQQDNVVIKGERYLVHRCHVATPSHPYALWAGKGTGYGLRAGRRPLATQMCLDEGAASSDPDAGRLIPEH
jgi:hypothetical protein